MVIYWVIFLIFLVFASSDVCLRKSLVDKKVIFCVSLLILIAFAAPRYDVGRDDLNYDDLFHTIRQSRDFFNAADIFVEPGYLLLNKLISFFSSSSFWVFLVSALVAVGLNLRAYFKMSPYFCVSVLLYFVHTFLYREMNEIRAGIACAICVSTVPLITKRKYIKVVAAILVASLFHTVALIFIGGCIVVWLKPSSRVLCLVVGIALLIGFFYPMGRVISAVLGQGNSNNDLLIKAATYSDEEGASKIGIFSNPTTIKQLVFAFIFLFNRKWFVEKVAHFDTLLILYFVSLSWLIMFNDVAILAGRIATVFSVGEVILVPCLLMPFKLRSRFLVFIGIVVINIVIFSLNLYLVKPVGNYQTIFSKQ